MLPDDGFGDGTGDSVYAGMAVRGRIRAVLLRGAADRLRRRARGRPPAGRYLPSADTAS